MPATAALGVDVSPKKQDQEQGPTILSCHESIFLSPHCRLIKPGSARLQPGAMSPEATNSIAGGNATGMENPVRPCKGRIEHVFDPCRVGTILLYVPVALPPAIEFDAFGDIEARLEPGAPGREISSGPVLTETGKLKLELHTSLSTQHSALSTQHSALSTQHSALSTQHSALSTQHSALSLRRWAPGGRDRRRCGRRPPRRMGRR